jgi:predicted oxidoreductase
MEKVSLQGDLQFSRIIHGQWRLSDWGFTPQETLSFMEQCVEMGVTTFDTADIYGGYTCEGLLGKAIRLKPEFRDKIEIVTKCGIKLTSNPSYKLNHYDSSKEHILASVNQSLKNMNTDYIDVLLIHRPDFLMDPAEMNEAFSQLKQEGKVRHFGVSNFLPSQLSMLQKFVHQPLVTNQIELSVMNRTQFENGSLDQAIEYRMPPMAWSPLAGGSIFSSDDPKAERVRQALEKVGSEIGAKEIDQVMYAWLLKHPAKIMPIVGSGKIERVQSAVDSLQLQMNREQWYEIWVASRGRKVD